jgi:hypothetical protein
MWYYKKERYQVTIYDFILLNVIFHLKLRVLEYVQIWIIIKICLFALQAQLYHHNKVQHFELLNNNVLVCVYSLVIIVTCWCIARDKYLHAIFNIAILSHILSYTYKIYNLTTTAICSITATYPVVTTMHSIQLLVDAGLHFILDTCSILTTLSEC